LASTGAFTATAPTDGIVTDYNAPTGRFSVFSGDGFSWYTGGIGTTSIMTLSSAGSLSTAGLTVNTNLLTASSSTVSIGSSGSGGNLTIYAGTSVLNGINVYGYGSFLNQPSMGFVTSTGSSIGSFTFDGAGLAFSIYSATTSSNVFNSSLSNGNLTITGAHAYKTGSTTAWEISSDSRVKKDIVDYTLGLSDLVSLRTVTYKYNGMYGSQDNGEICHGLIAQDLLATNFSDMVSTYTYTDKDTGDKTDLYRIDVTQLTYALINAVKELKKEFDDYKASHP